MKHIAITIATVFLLGCNPQSITPIQSPVIPFSLVQENQVIGEQTVVGVRIVVDSQEYMRILVEHNGVEFERRAGDCDDWLLSSNDFKVGDDVTAHLRIGEVYRDTYCILIK